MRSLKQNASCTTLKNEEGSTLVELLVVFVIISLLAVSAVPLAETTSQRRKEIVLQEALRNVRTGIDAFHNDWVDGRLNEDADEASDNGYPVTLSVLTRGVEITNTAGEKMRRKYLRRIPRNPFFKGSDLVSGWSLIGYAQTGGKSTWDGNDVYDLRAITDKESLDGTPIAEW